MLFDAVVVDEAAQALEPATLIPLQLLKPGGRVVLVGDTRQLPPTVLSRAAEGARLAQSLFERLERCGWPVVMLRQQYRMHPAISAWPGRWFYDGRLSDGAGVDASSRGAPFHGRAGGARGPFVVWDCGDGRERGGGGGGGGSLRNDSEVKLVAALAAGLLADHPEDVGSIVLLTPYRAQASALRAAAAADPRLGAAAAAAGAALEVSTVDGFQGREADVVILSCVRAQPGTATAGGGGVVPGGGARVGFLADVRRMNVGLTRARRSLWVVCHAATLAGGGGAWRPLLEEAAARGALFEARAPYARAGRAAPRAAPLAAALADAAAARAAEERARGAGGAAAGDQGAARREAQPRAQAAAPAAEQRRRSNA
ncbi:MAG: AAA domain-containing protein [Monoraphidium minutum]|nr:MAG: AAA domain-containing protein [Monoraphidium minutum]